MMGTSTKLPLHIAFFTGYIPPYALPVFQEIDRRIQRLSILVSTPMESNRKWQASWGDLDVHVQRTFTRLSRWKHRIGFRDTKQTHLPFDTLFQLRKLRPDVIVSEELGLRSVLCSLYQLLHRRTPLVLVCNLSEHTEQGRGLLRKLLRKWLARRAWITTVNGLSGARYLEGIGFRQDSIFLFPYTCQPGVFEQVPLDRPAADAIRLVACGELSSRKGYLPFLKSLDGWCRDHCSQKVSLQIIGTGPLESEIRQIEPPSNLTLEVMGQRDYHEIARVYGQADIFVFPTLADEWGLVVNEALAAGLPVLGSKYSQAVEELIVEGNNGWMFDAIDPQDTSRALNRALTTSPSDLSAMRASCRQTVAERTPAWAAEKFVSAVLAACSQQKESSSK